MGIMLLEYLFLLILLTVLTRRVQTERSFSFIPFWSYRTVLGGGHCLLLTQMIANIVAFIPVGLLLGYVFVRSKWWIIMLIGGAYSVLIESLQFVLKRGFSEFDDVFHNVLGCMFGYGLYLAIAWLVKRVMK